MSLSNPLGPPFLPFAGPTLRRPAASLTPCSSGTGTSKGHAQHGIGADTMEPPVRVSHWAHVGDICVPTVTPNLPHCQVPVMGTWEAAGPPQTLWGPGNVQKT